MTKVIFDKTENLVKWKRGEFCGSTYVNTLLDNTMLVQLALTNQVEDEMLANRIVQDMINHVNERL